MTELLSKELNCMLTDKDLCYLGEDTQGDPIEHPDQDLLMLIDQIYEVLGGSVEGGLTAEQMQSFLISLILQEITPEKLDYLPDLIRRQTGQLMNHMQHSGGICTARNFKKYFLTQRLRNKEDVKRIHFNAQRVMKAIGTGSTMEALLEKEAAKKWKGKGGLEVKIAANYLLMNWFSFG